MTFQLLCNTSISDVFLITIFDSTPDVTLKFSDFPTQCFPRSIPEGRVVKPNFKGGTGKN